MADGRLDARRYESYCNLFLGGRSLSAGARRDELTVSETNRTQSVVQESAILVGVLLPDRQLEEDPLAELAGLAETAGAHVVGSVTQRRESPDITTYLGKGKVEELKNLAQATDADVILFDNDLSPAQTRNLEQAAGTKVLDRSELILDIFASPRPYGGSPPGRRTGAIAILPAAAEADVDALVTVENGHRHARAG